MAREPALRPWLLALAVLGLALAGAVQGVRSLPTPWPSVLETLLLTGLLILAALIAIDASFGQPIGITRWGHGALHRFAALFSTDRGALWLAWAGRGGSLSWSLDCLHRSAAKGNPEGMREYARHFLDGGMGVAARGAALPWLRRAAEAGDAPAAFFLAEMLRWGVGCLPRPTEALGWYLQAAQGGYRPAARWLAQAYGQGEGVEADPARAAQWAGRAEAMGAIGGGERPAPNLLAVKAVPAGSGGATAGQIYDEVAEALWEMKGYRILVVGLALLALLTVALFFAVIPFLRLLLGLAILVVLVTTALMRLLGHHTPRASRSGKALAARAEAGDAEANFQLGLRLEQGHPELPRDPVQARIHYSRAAGAGHPLAVYHLADLLSWGMGGPADPAQARRLLEPLARGGHPEAMARLQRLATGLSPGPPVADQVGKGEAP